MSDLQSVVGEDVNLTPDQPEQAAEQPQEQAAEPQSEPQEPQEPRMVPLPALHEERQKRRELQQQLMREQQAREEMGRRFEERMAALQQAMTPRQEIPDPTTDPIGHLTHTVKEAERAAKASQQEVQALRQAEQQEQQLRVIASRVQQTEAAFAAQNPDYFEAINFFRQSRARELEAYGMDPESANQQAGREMTEGALMHAARGMDPAAMTYQFAKARGYQPKNATNANPADKMAMQQKGVAAAKSLGSGGAAKGKLSVEALLSMSDQEFAEATKGEKWESMWR